MSEVWQRLPWTDESVHEVSLGDLPSRLDPRALALCWKKIWGFCREGATVKVRVPHPRHNTFLRDFRYITPLAPESFEELDPRSSRLGLPQQLGINFEIILVGLELDPYWQQKVDEGRQTYDEISLLSRHVHNVVAWINVEFKVHKSPWIRIAASQLDPAERAQLLDQLETHAARGNLDLHQTIQNFLEDSNAK